MKWEKELDKQDAICNVCKSGIKIFIHSLLEEQTKVTMSEVTAYSSGMAAGKVECADELRELDPNYEEGDLDNLIKKWRK